MLLPSLWQPFKSALEMDKILMIDTCFHEILVFPVCETSMEVMLFQSEIFQCCVHDKGLP